MSYDYNSAVYAVNSYTWKLLEANLGWVKSEYPGGRTPIIPSAQQPELLQANKAFLVYGSAMHPVEHNYEIYREALSYSIYAPSATEANKISSLLYEVFKRQDDAAYDVNEWMIQSGSPQDVHLGSIRVAMTERAEASEEEGGMYTALVMLEIVYTMNNLEIVTSNFDS